MNSEKLDGLFKTTQDIKQAILKKIVKEAKWMSPERDREVAMKYNTLSFISEFDWAPKDEQEALDWVAETVANLDV